MASVFGQNNKRLKITLINENIDPFKLNCQMRHITHLCIAKHKTRYSVYIRHPPDMADVEYSIDI